MEIADLEKLFSGTASRIPVTVRGVTLIFRPLSIDETTAITSLVLGQLELLKPNERHTQNEAAINAKVTLEWASSMKPNNAEPKVLQSTLGKLTADEIGFVFGEYQANVARLNPKLEEIPLAELNALVESLKKNPSHAIDCSTLELVNLVRFLLTETASPTV